MAWVPRIELEWARQRRGAMRAAGGVLDLVLPIRIGGRAQPLFCAHPVIGLSWCYTSLVQHVDPEHAMYGLQSRGLRRPEPLPASMAELARDFADHIRATQPAGPYHLLGWSLGGHVALAVAEELERRGDEIALLAVLDAYPHDPRIREQEPIWLLYNIVLSDFGYQPTLQPDEHRPEEHVLEVIRGRPGRALDDWSDERVRALLRVIRNNMRLAIDYRPGRLRCGLLFIAGTQTPPALEQKLERWRPHVGGPIDVVEIDCRHEHMMMAGPAAQIGAVLTARLAAARRTAPPDAPATVPHGAGPAVLVPGRG